MISDDRLRKIIFSLAAVFCLLLPAISSAQTPVVYGVFFYSPTCPHCRDVLTNHWPAIQNEFGDQLRVLFIDATTPQGGRLMMDAEAALGIQANGVPMLIIGSDVLVGSLDIPERTRSVVRAGLNAGGIGLPAIPGIEAVYQAAIQGTSQADQTQTFIDRLAADPVANGLAVLILILLTLSTVIAARRFWGKLSQSKARQRQHQHLALTLLSLLGLVMSLSLAVGWSNAPAVLVLAGGEFLIFLVIAGVSLRVPREQALPRWLVPLTAVGGLVVAAYLTFIEVTLTEAVCGLVGDCNTVQQSLYARILNVPVGVFGLAAYCLILVIWLLSRNPRSRVRANWLVSRLVLLGVLFSIYLTFLEPFVIGATCIWCLTSAVVMLILLWLLIPVASPDAVTRSSRKPVTT